MSTLLRCVAALILFSLLPSAQLAPAQGKPGTASPTPSNFPAEFIRTMTPAPSSIPVGQSFPGKSHPRFVLNGAWSHRSLTE